jgi:hypothetical protein
MSRNFSTQQELEAYAAQSEYPVEVDQQGRVYQIRGNRAHFVGSVTDALDNIINQSFIIGGVAGMITAGVLAGSLLQ